MAMRSKRIMAAAGMATATGLRGIEDVIASVLSAGDKSGRTTDDIAGALNRADEGAALQVQLEALVRRGILDRRGIGHGALYTLATPARTTRTPRLLRLRTHARLGGRRGATPTLAIGAPA